MQRVRLIVSVIIGLCITWFGMQFGDLEESFLFFSLLLYIAGFIGRMVYKADDIISFVTKSKCWTEYSAKRQFLEELAQWITVLFGGIIVYLLSLCALVLLNLGMSPAFVGALIELPGWVILLMACIPFHDKIKDYLCGLLKEPEMPNEAESD